MTAYLFMPLTRVTALCRGVQPGQGGCTSKPEASKHMICAVVAALHGDRLVATTFLLISCIRLI